MSMSGASRCTIFNLKSKLSSSVPPPPRPRISCSSPSSPHINGPRLRFGTALRDCHKINVRCSSSTGPGGPASVDSDSKSVLDAFFLGKALAEALNERVESAVGEFLITIGRLQAEQQKQVQDFQEDVVERAKNVKEQAAREAVAGRAIISKPTTVDTTSVNDGVSQPPSPSDEKGSNPADMDPAFGASSHD